MLRDSMKAAISLVAPAATYFLIRLHVGRVLGEDALGIYSLVWAVYSFALLAATLGMGSGLTRYAAQLGGSPSRQSRILIVGLLQTVVTALLAAIVLIAVAQPMSTLVFGVEALAVLLQYAAVALPGAAVGKAVLGFLNGRRKFGTYALVSVAQNVAVVLCSLACIESGLGIRGATIGLLAPASAVGLASLGSLRSAIRLGIKSLHAVPFSRSLFTFGLLVTLTNGVGLVQGYTDTLMIGAYLGEREVGAYTAALLALQLTAFAGHAVQISTTPRIAAQWRRGAIEDMCNTIDHALNDMTAVVLPLAFSLALGSKLLVGFVFGDGFDNATSTLTLLMPGAAAIGIWSAVGTVLSSTGHVRTALRLSLLSAGVNVLLNAALIPALGIRGAAMATSTSLILGCTLEAYVVQKRLGVRLRWTQPALAGLLLALSAAALLLTARTPTTVLGMLLSWMGASVLCAAMLPEPYMRRAGWDWLRTRGKSRHDRKQRR